jgi:hypothetical protein
LEASRNRRVLITQLNYVENEIDVLGSPRIRQEKFHCLSTDNDKIISRRPERLQQFKEVDPLRLRNHAALQRR